MKHMPLAASRRPPGHPLQWLGLFVGLLLLGLLARPAWAAEPDDPPGRVGRLAELQGQVWVYAAESNEWISAARNRPVTTGDRLSTEADGRAEVRIGSTVLRIAPNTEVEVVRLDDDRTHLHLHSGSLSARLRTREAADEFSLRTDEGRFVTQRPGQYRFDRFDDTSSATAVNGQARYESDGTALDVASGQRVEFWKERGAPQYSITEPRRDDFAGWVASLDAREERSVSSRYVSPEMTGVEDLDRHGRWEPETEYGAVWIPRTVVAGWAPYRMGHWAWVRPWGWTWVDDAPWGFAPFHYGRWVWYRNVWCWAPGRYVARPVYAPALVAWVGGTNVNVSVRVGGPPTVGWFPLGPREVYVPGYRVSPRYVQNVNVTHITNITNVNAIVRNPNEVMANTRYVNRGLPQAVTVVPSQVVERRQPVAPAHSPVNERNLRDMTRERPRADPPVVAPPRLPPGIQREVVDPRTSRPAVPRPVQARERDNGGPARPPVMTAPRAPDRDGRDGRDGREARDGRDGRDDRRDGRDGRDARDGRDGGRGRDAPVGAPAPAVVAPPQNPGFSPMRPDRAERPDRPDRPDRSDRPDRPDRPDPRADRTPGRPDAPRIGAPPQPPVQPIPAPPRANPPPVISAPPAREFDRNLPPPQREERRRQQHHDMPSPPQAQPRPQVQAPPMPAPAPQVRAPAAPPPMMAPPPVMQRREAPPPQQPEARQRGPERERVERGDRNDRGERGERR